jgi:hypothetical protein
MSNPAALTSLRQPLPDVSRSNPGSASGAAISANDPGAAGQRGERATD